MGRRFTTGVDTNVPIKALLGWSVGGGAGAGAGAGVTDASALAALSNRTGTAWRRHVQSLHECGDRRNPDMMAGALLDETLREQCRRLDASALAALRRDPYHLYLVARTQAYDQVLLDAVARGARRVLILGSGLDTRCHRFGAHLAAMGVAVAEADQAPAIAHKQAVAARLPHADRVNYLEIDLNQAGTWARTLAWLAQEEGPCLVISEGVSPYIEQAAFTAMLGEMARCLPTGSRLTYDFKRVDVNDHFGATDAVRQPFRLAFDGEALAAFHRERGFGACMLTGPGELMRRHVPSWTADESSLFDQDALVDLQR